MAACLGGVFGNDAPKIDPRTGKPLPGRRGQSMGEKIIASAAQSAARSIGTHITRAILRNVLGGMLGGKR